MGSRSSPNRLTVSPQPPPPDRLRPSPKFGDSSDRLSDRLFGAGEIEAVEVVMSRVQHAMLHAFGQYSNAVLDQVKISEDELRAEARTVSTA